MSSDEAVLKQYLVGYMHPDFTKSEVLSVIKLYKSLSFRLSGYVLNNGTWKDLLNLSGTIPVNYKGSFYNIPICIWLMDTHPNNAPLCYVKPTPDMSIKVSKYVDTDGKVYMPYLNQWNAQTSSMLGLISCMIAAFGELPPVYSRPRGEARQPPYPVSQPGYPPLPTPPYPPAAALPYPAYPGFLPAPCTPAAYPAAFPSGTITEEHIKASLLSAVEDKLRRRLRELAQQSAAELDTLRRTQHELRAGSARLDDVLTRLAHERRELERSVAMLHDKQDALQRSTEALAARAGVNADEAVAPTAPLYAQLLDACAEEAALDDAVYYMGEALRNQRVDLDTFLKQVRALGRRQFTLRAIMHKCRQKAHLAC